MCIHFTYTFVYVKCILYVCVKLFGQAPHEVDTLIDWTLHWTFQLDRCTLLMKAMTKTLVKWYETDRQTDNYTLVCLEKTDGQVTDGWRKATFCKLLPSACTFTVGVYLIMHYCTCASEKSRKLKMPYYKNCAYNNGLCWRHKMTHRGNICDSEVILIKKGHGSCR